MKRDIFLMILNSKKHEGQVPELELALLFQISLLLYLVKRLPMNGAFCRIF